MNRVIVRSSHLLCALLAATLTAGGCTTTTPSGTDPSSSVTGAQGDTVIAASDQTREASGIAYYVIHADGSGTAFSSDGVAVASFRGSSDGSRGSFELRAGDSALHLDFTMSRGDDGSLTIEGTANGQALSIAVAKDGHVIRQSGPALDGRLRPLLQGMTRDFSANTVAHEVNAGRCALGLAILAGALILAADGIPTWLIQGGSAAISGCSG